MVIFLGFLIGFLAAIPLGPLNIFAISQSIKHGFSRGFSVGLTASFLDIIYCFFAIIGISYATQPIDELIPLMKFIGAVLLIVISVQLIKQSKNFERESPHKNHYKAHSGPVMIALLLYVSNPTIYTFWLAVAGIVTAHQGLTHAVRQPALFALACGCGSAVWYFILAKYTSKYQRMFKPKAFRMIVVGLSILLIGLAIYNLGTLFIG